MSSIFNEHQEYIIGVLGIGDGVLRAGTRVMLKSELDASLPDNPGLDYAGERSVMLTFAGKVVTLCRDTNPDGRRFKIIEDGGDFWWDPRWIEYIIPEEDNFEPAPDSDFELLFL